MSIVIWDTDLASENSQEICKVLNLLDEGEGATGMGYQFFGQGQGGGELVQVHFTEGQDVKKEILFLQLIPVHTRLRSSRQRPISREIISLRPNIPERTRNVTRP
jgi:hypothetical protein